MELSKTLKEKVYRAFTEQKFIGVVRYSEDEYQELLAYTSKYSRSFALGNGWYLYGDDEIHFATLVEIAKRWKSDDIGVDEDNGFWPFVYSTVGINWMGEQKIYKAYTELIATLSYNKKILVADTKKWYYATIMMHAFAPYKSMSAFFDFVYNIFKKDLDFDYTVADREVCDMATEGFCAVAQSLGGKNVDVSIGSGAYGIKIGLRSMALGNETRAEFVDLFDKALHTINLLYHGNDAEDSNYLVNLIKEWWERKTEKDLPSGAKRVSATTKQNITPKFLRKGDKVYLCIQPIRFASGEDPKLWLSIYVDNSTNPIESKEIFTRRGEITVTSVQQDIELNYLLQKASGINFRVEITENGKDIFNKTITKDFIVFDNEKELSNRILKTGNYFVYTLTIDELQLPTAINTIARNLYNIYPTEGEVLCSEQRQVVFTSQPASISSKIQIMGESGICRWEYQDKLCKVFGNRVNLFVPQDATVNGLELRIDGVRTLLSNLVAISEESYFVYDITDMIPQRVPCELIVYSYLKEKELIHNDIISIPKLHIGFSKPIFFGDENRQVRVSVGSHCKDLSWEIGEDIVSCTLCKGHLDITIPQFKWRIDVGEWQYKPIRDIIWYKDYLNNGSGIEVQSPIDISTTKLYCVGDGKTQEIPLNAASKYGIGKYVFANEGRKVLAFFFKSVESNDRKEICEITTVEHFTQEPPFVVDNGNLQFVGEKYYVGSKKPYFNICLKRIGKDEINIKSTELTDGIMADIDEGIYWIKVSVPSGGLFGGGEKTLWEGEFVFGDRDKLKLSNLVLKINPICGIGTGDFWKTNSRGYYVSELVREEVSDTYTAKIYYKNSLGEQSDVSGFLQCRIVIISPKALQVLVKDMIGNYTERLKCDSSGNLYSPKSEQKFYATNYHFIEVKNV